MPNEPTTARAVDSLSANEFAMELDGALVTGIFRISGLVAFKIDITTQSATRIHDPIVMTKMVQRDPQLPFNRWLKDTIDAKDEPARRAIEIIALDDGEEVRRWRVTGARVSEISYSDFDSASNELVQQRLLIHYDAIEEIWP